MDSRGIEMRLRLPAPDEPAVLPPLLLPAFDEAPGRIVSSVRIRRVLPATRDARSGLAIVLLALAAAAVVLAGALRLLNDRTLPLNQLHWPPAQGALGIQDGFTLAWPEDWHRLAEGGLYQGDFTQAGISYERVAVVLASSTLPCSSPGATGASLVVPSGDPAGIPRETADPALACLRSAPLAPGGIRLVVEVGERTRGLAAPDGPAIRDTSEPVAAAGWTARVDGQPARLTTSGGAAAGVAETRIWDVIFPGTIDHVLRVHADLGAGPNLDRAREAVQAVVDSIDFAAAAPVLDPASGAATLTREIDQLDRGARENRSDFFACFPREPGTTEATISSGPFERLSAPVRVSCTTDLEPSITGLWRITLTTTWQAGDGYPAGGMVNETFARPDDTAPGGGGSGWTIRSIGDGAPSVDGSVVLPQAPRSLPPAADSPPAVGEGSFVELLWPGLAPSELPGQVSDDRVPWMVGWRFAVAGEPHVIDGLPWYPVQWDDGWRASTKWLAATRDGRPTIAPVEVRCPTSTVDLETIMWLGAAERRACFGNADLTFESVMAGPSNAGGSACAGAGPEPVPCPTTGGMAWLEGDPRLLLFAAGPNGRVPGLAAWMATGAGDALPTGVWLRVTGHFDDMRATDCRRGPTGELVTDEDAIRGLVLECRNRFVVTAYEPSVVP